MFIHDVKIIYLLNLHVITFGLHMEKSVCNVYLHIELNSYVNIRM